MIQPIGFIDAAAFTASYVVKYKQHMRDGTLKLRSRDPADVLLAVADEPILGEWKAAAALLSRYRSHARNALKDSKIELGEAWIEMLPGGHGTPWRQYEDDYAQAHIRTRLCLIPAPDAFTYSGHFREILAVGVVNVVEHRVLHSDTNFSTFPRVHLVVDVERPDAHEVE